MKAVIVDEVYKRIFSSTRSKSRYKLLLNNELQFFIDERNRRHVVEVARSNAGIEIGYYMKDGFRKLQEVEDMLINNLNTTFMYGIDFDAIIDKGYSVVVNSDIGYVNIMSAVFVKMMDLYTTKREEKNISMVTSKGELTIEKWYLYRAIMKRYLVQTYSEFAQDFCKRKSDLRRANIRNTQALLPFYNRNRVFVEWMIESDVCINPYLYDVEMRQMLSYSFLAREGFSNAVEYGENIKVYYLTSYEMCIGLKITLSIKLDVEMVNNLLANIFTGSLDEKIWMLKEFDNDLSPILTNQEHEELNEEMKKFYKSSTRLEYVCMMKAENLGINDHRRLYSALRTMRLVRNSEVSDLV